MLFDVIWNYRCFFPSFGHEVLKVLECHSTSFVSVCVFVCVFFLSWKYYGNFIWIYQTIMSNFRKWNCGLSSDKTISWNGKTMYCNWLWNVRATGKQQLYKYLYWVWRFNDIHKCINHQFLWYIYVECLSTIVRRGLRASCKEYVSNGLVVVIVAVVESNVLNGSAFNCFCGFSQNRTDFWMTLSKHVINADDINIHRVQSSSDNEIVWKNNDLAFCSVAALTHNACFRLPTSFDQHNAIAQSQLWLAHATKLKCFGRLWTPPHITQTNSFIYPKTTNTVESNRVTELLARQWKFD